MEYEIIKLNHAENIRFEEICMSQIHMKTGRLIIKLRNYSCLLEFQQILRERGFVGQKFLKVTKLWSSTTSISILGNHKVYESLNSGAIKGRKQMHKLMHMHMHTHKHTALQHSASEWACEPRVQNNTSALLLKQTELWGFKTYCYFSCHIVLKFVR